MDSALFYRKCTNSNEYFKLANYYPDLGSKLKFTISHTIILTSDEYNNFVNNFLWDNDTIKNITKDLYMDEMDIVHCAFFTVDGSHGFLVYPSGYNYARYVAYYKLTKKILKGEEYV